MRTLLFLFFLSSMVTGQVNITHQTMLPKWITNSTAAGRDAGISALLWSRLLWLFGDTFTQSGQFVASCTVGWSVEERTPWHIVEYAPWQFFPFTKEEQHFNEQHTQSHVNPCCLDNTNCSQFYCHCPPGTDCLQRYAIWPGDAWEYNRTHALVLYGELFTGWAPFDFRPIGVGAAWILRDDPSTARRVFAAPNEPAFIWNATEPTFTEGVRWGSQVYLYANINPAFCATDTLLARAPLASAMDRSSYAYYVAPGKWSSSLADAKSLGRFANGLGSVIWSLRYKQFMAFNLGFCSGNVSVFRLAPTPWGPWDPTGTSYVIAGAGDGSYAGEAHQELQTSHSMIISFLQPNNTVWFDGEIRLVNLTFA